MNLDQVKAVLAYASATDPRIRRNDPAERELQAQAWARHLGNVDQEAAVAAIDGYYARAGVDAILPGDIRATASSGPPRGAAAAIAHAEGGPGDRLAADRDQRALPAGPEDAARERAEFRARMQAISDGWAMSRPTGYVGERERHSPRREPVAWIPAPFGAQTTVCFGPGCVVDIAAPAGWDPANPASPRLFCDRHRPASGTSGVGAA